MLLPSCSGNDVIPAPEEEAVDEVVTIESKVSDFLKEVGPESVEGTEIWQLALSEVQRAISQRGNEQAFKLLSELYHGNDLFISPLGVQYILGLLYDAAEGDTAKEIAAYLSSGDIQREDPDGYFKLLTEKLPLLDKGLTLSVANAAFVDKDFSIDPNFKTSAVQNYRALTAEMDFSDASFVREVVNTWCSRHTNGLIPELIDDGAPCILPFC